MPPQEGLHFVVGCDDGLCDSVVVDLRGALQIEIDDAVGFALMASEGHPCGLRTCGNDVPADGEFVAC